MEFAEFEEPPFLVADELAACSGSSGLVASPLGLHSLAVAFLLGPFQSVEVPFGLVEHPSSFAAEEVSFGSVVVSFGLEAVPFLAAEEVSFDLEEGPFCSAACASAAVEEALYLDLVLLAEEAAFFDASWASSYLVVEEQIEGRNLEVAELAASTFPSLAFVVEKLLRHLAFGFLDETSSVFSLLALRISLLVFLEPTLEAHRPFQKSPSQKNDGLICYAELHQYFLCELGTHGSSFPALNLASCGKWDI